MNIQSRIAFYLFSTMLISYPLSSYATMYKWVDKNNQVQYSNIEPDTANFEIVKPPPGPSSSAPAEIQNLKNQQKSLSDQKEKETLNQQKADQKKQAADILAENCAAARNKLTTLTYTPRVRQLSKDTGEFEVLSPEALQSAIAKARAEVEKYCGPKLPS